MQRREFVTTATIATASIAGCSDIFGDDGSSGPESALEAYVDAINDNDPEAFQDAIHPESPEGGAGDVTEADLEPISMSIESSEVVEGPENGEAVVDAELETTVEMMGQEQSETQEVSYEVRTHEDDWKLYQEV